MTGIQKWQNLRIILTNKTLVAQDDTEYHTTPAKIWVCCWPQLYENDGSISNLTFQMVLSLSAKSIENWNRMHATHTTAKQMLDFLFLLPRKKNHSNNAQSQRKIPELRKG